VTPETTQSHLENLRDELSLRRFFSALGYAPEDDPYFLDNALKSDIAAQNALADDLKIIAKHGDFPIFYGRLREKLSVSDERLVVERVIASGHPYGLFVFSDAGQNCFRFLNVKIDGNTAARRRLLRRFTVDPSQSLGRTTIERLGALDLALLTPILPGMAHQPLEIQTLHARAFDVESVTQGFYNAYETIFGRVKSAATPRAGLDFDESARHDWTQRLFNRLMFLRFLERKKWLLFDGKTDYLRGLFRAAEANGENFLHDRLYWAFFWGLGTPNDAALGDLPRAELELKRGDVPFLNGGLFTALETFDDRDAVTLDNPIAREILDFFDRFNFTITESTPFDVEVAVDPEMLGKVFEELVTGRHESGSYYTPRPIVSFMGREALKGFLAQSGEGESAISRFVEDGDASGLKNPERVLELLKSVTICDPACGSGAYLLGSMQELLRLRQALFVSTNLDALTLYERKLEIISRNLYGVDKSEFAVNIAMLRLWLSLIIDFDGPRDAIPALPNLGYKIGCGDSLAAPDPLAFSDLFAAPYLEHAAKLGALHEEHLRHGIELKAGRAVRSYAEIEAAMSAEAEEVQKLFGTTIPAGWFDWRLGFAEVLARGGFDIALANPPYLSTKHGCGKDNKKSLQQIYVTAKGQFDAYGLFIERGIMLLKSGGMLAYIVPQPVLTNSNMQPVRDLLEAQTLLSLSDPGMAFNAGVEPVVIIVQKMKPADGKSKEVNIFSADDLLRHLPLSQLKTTSGVWNMHLEDLHNDDACLARLPRFGECFTIKRGAECGKKDENIRVGGTSGYPLLRGEDVEAFFVHPSNLRLQRDKDESKWKPLSLYQPNNLLIRRVTSQLTAAVDVRGHHVLNTLYVVQPKPDCSVSVEFAAAWLNSDLIRGYFSRTFVNRDKLFPYIRKEQIEALPLLTPSPAMLKRIEDEVAFLSNAGSSQDRSKHQTEIETLLRLALEETWNQSSK